MSSNPLEVSLLQPECSTYNHCIYVQVNNICTRKITEFFFITLVTSAGDVLRESNMSHDPGQAVAHFTISLPQGADVCSLHVRISAGNSAGMSAPTKTVEVGKLQFFL